MHICSYNDRENIHKTYKYSNQTKLLHRMGSWACSPKPILRNFSIFLGEEELVFFGSVTPGRSTTLQQFHIQECLDNSNGC